MSEPRWDEAGSRPQAGDAPRTHPSPRGRRSGEPLDRERHRPSRPPLDRSAPPSRTQPRWGALPWGRGSVLVAGGAALGTVATVLTGSEPGPVLGVFLIAGAVAAALAVRPRAVYRIIPAPALAYVGGGVIAGLIHDRATDTTRTALAINAAQWVASGFLAMSAATVLVIAIGAARWQSSRRRPAGPRYPPPGSRAAGSPEPGRRSSLTARPPGNRGERP